MKKKKSRSHEAMKPRGYEGNSSRFEVKYSEFGAVQQVGAPLRHHGTSPRYPRHPSPRTADHTWTRLRHVGTTPPASPRIFIATFFIICIHSRRKQYRSRRRRYRRLHHHFEVALRYISGDHILPTCRNWRHGHQQGVFSLSLQQDLGTKTDCIRFRVRSCESVKKILNQMIGVSTQPILSS